MAQDKTMTGALGIIRVRGTAVGRCRGIQWTENISRGEVRGIGTLITSEVPALSWGGTVSFDFYEVDFTKTGVPGAIRRDVQTAQEFEDQLVLDADGVQLDIFKKEEDLIDDGGLIVPKAVPYATLTQMFINSDGANLNEGAISGHNQSFVYLGPCIRPS